MPSGEAAKSMTACGLPVAFASTSRGSTIRRSVPVRVSRQTSWTSCPAGSRLTEHVAPCAARSRARASRRIVDSISRMRASIVARPGMRAKIASVASFCAFIHDWTCGSFVSSRKRYGSGTATPQIVSVSGRGAGGGGTSTPPNEAASATGATNRRLTSRATGRRTEVFIGRLCRESTTFGGWLKQDPRTTGDGVRRPPGRAPSAPPPRGTRRRARSREPSLPWRSAP